MAFLPLDGPSAQIVLSVTSAAVQEIKVGSVPLSERKIVTIQPLNGRVWVYFGDGATVPSAGTVAANGLLVYKGGKETYEAGEVQKLYILAVSSTTDVTVVERA